MQKPREAHLRSRQGLLTKCDNNAFIDIALYPEHRFWKRRDDVKGFVRDHIPQTGWIVIILQEFLLFKNLTLIVLVLLSLWESGIERSIPNLR